MSSNEEIIPQNKKNHSSMKYSEDEEKEVRRKSELDAITSEQYGLKYPLHKVIEMGDLGILEHVLPSQIDFIDSTDHFDRTPLQLAILLGKTDIYKTLLGARANPMVVDKNRFVKINFLHPLHDYNYLIIASLD